MLLQQGAADLLVGSKENEAAHTYEGDPRYAACKQAAEEEGKEQHMLDNYNSNTNTGRVFRGGTISTPSSLV